MDKKNNGVRKRKEFKIIREKLEKKRPTACMYKSNIRKVQTLFTI